MRISSRFIAGLVDQNILHRLDPFPDLFQNGEIIIDHGIDQGVGKVVRPQHTAARNRLADTFPHGIENVALLFLKGDDEIASEDDTDLFRRKVIHVLLEKDHFQGDIEIVVAFFHLRALPGVEDILLDEGMQIEMTPDFLHDGRIMYAGDIDPGDCRCFLEWKTVLDALHLHFPEVLRIEIHDGDFDLFGALFADKRQRTRRQSDLL